MSVYPYVYTVILLICNWKASHGKDQYVLPLNMGMQVAISYDIANIFNRPVLLGKFVNVVSALAMLAILFFGVIISPFGYFFGIPSEKYVLGHSWKDAFEMNQQKPRQLKTSFWDFDVRVLDWLFEEVPPRDKGICRTLFVCTAHHGLLLLPSYIIPIFKILSKRLDLSKEEYKIAIKNGLTMEEHCNTKYRSCAHDLMTIYLRRIISLMPRWMRKKSLRPNKFF